ncbi:MAG: hypothetical protein Tp1125DCM00d2C21254131_42 [Prokaryotic dsDNA virus sp.]|nr:MAG: hypothetical protein Tp1125DCM00d2C21254131_42 [Prokaryotic dsDNA virus sp.]|tara:strand:- start:123 stop:902 length:780 start_codon:yes stop_codon:yes gene_type:complete
MTTVSQIITDAYRQGNLIARGTSPTTAEQTEGLRYLSRIVKSVFGNEAGEDLNPFPIGRKDINRPQGYPWYNDVPDNDWYVPKNLRLMLNLEDSVTLYLHPVPDDGSRFAVKDVAGNLSTYNVTVYGNGRNIDGASSVVLNTDGEAGEWFYREDTGNWQKYAPMAVDDEFPFPEEFDDFFITMLAIRLNPSYGVALDGQSNATLARSKRQLVARYRQIIPTPSELALLRMTKMSDDRQQWLDSYHYLNPNTAFDSGWPY